MFFAYAAVSALFGRRGLALSVACLGLLVAWSRIYLGIHFPLDMLGAALVGPLAAVAAVPAVRRFRRRPPARLQRPGAPRAQARSA